MARTTPEATLNTRSARTKLKRRPKPYFRLARGGALPVHLGYYRQAEGRPGTWIARRYLGDQRYEMFAVGTADDDPRHPADGSGVLDFDQAQRAALAWADRRLADERADKAAATSPTVRRAVDAYIAARKARDIIAGADAELRLAHHVLAAPLADVPLTSLTEKHFAEWRAGLRRGGRGHRDDATPLAAGTLARLLNDLRAALRASATKAKLPADVLTTIREGCTRPEDASRPRPKQILPDADVRLLVEAAAAEDEDFGDLVMVLAATGARFDQVARATVADFQADQRRIMVPVSKKGRGTKAQSVLALPLPDDVVARLRQLVAGRAGHEPLLQRWHHRQEAGDKSAGRLPRWVRTVRRPWSDAAEMTRPWRAAMQAAGLAADLVPYCLRHSSIVRGLRAGLPVRLVAAIHDTSIAMIEKHYAAFITDATEDLLRRVLVPLGVAPVTVTSIDAARAKRAVSA
jgi:integrase